MTRPGPVTASVLAAGTLMLCASCGTASVTALSDSVRVEVRTVREWVPVKVSVPLPVLSEARAVRDTSDTLSNAYARSVAAVRRGGTLYHDLATLPSAVEATVYVPSVRRDSIVYADREVRVEVPVEVERGLTRWQAFRLRWFGALCALSAALLAWTFRKPLLTFVRKMLV